MHVTAVAWVVTLALIAGLLALDWLLLGRRPHKVRFGEAIRWSLFYIAVAVLFGVGFGADRRLGPRHPVLRRLPGREEPVGRQPVRVRDHHQRLRSSRRAAAQGAHDRDRHRARAARGVHRARRRAAGHLLVHVPDLRPDARRDRRPALPPPQRGPRRRRQRARRSRPPEAADHRQLRPGPDHHPPPRPPGVHAAAPRAAGDRQLPICCSRSTRSPPSSASPTTPTSSSPPTRSRCSASAPCTSSSPACSNRLVYLSTGLAAILAFIGAKLILEFAHQQNHSDPRDPHRALARR